VHGRRIILEFVELLLRGAAQGLVEFGGGVLGAQQEADLGKILKRELDTQFTM